MSNPLISEQALLHLHSIANEAGCDAMSGILEIVYDRESVPNERLLALTADDVDDLYDRFVGPAVDSIEDHLSED